MSTKRKASAKIAHPVVRQSAKKPLKSQINESETAVSVAEASKADSSGPTEAIIEISSDADSSEYEVSDHELDDAHDDAHDVQPEDTTSVSQRPTEALRQKHDESTGADISMADSSIPNDTESDQELAQPTLGELARAHGTIDVPSALTPQSDAVAAQGRAIAPPSHSSLGTVLSQALRTDDADLLESCLHVTDGNTIENTIQRLDSTLASILLTKLASRMHRRPGRAGSLMTWVQSTLVCHGGALAAQPGLVKRLSELQRVLDERARGLNSLLALKGKLDLMNAQLKLRRQQWNSEVDEDIQDEEGIIYVEGEDSDADIVNGLMDLDDDELPVTNGILDDESEDDDLRSNASGSEGELDAEEELDEDEVNHDDIESDEDDSEGETGPEPPSKRSKPSRGS
ncbi:Dip2/Utp12 family-domain-containing protein [Xylaria sp. FL1042]|nr:Dip2/Utp12 family-domain-containing protein [Xylaria sp. FL1042]